mmetsp:Transcript_23184/g.69009  ORF Transcript_23184/g.69009 Transcript_23184/m.69009 type:complete len:291 (+) Transcript_23184:281-1153(+)
MNDSISVLGEGHARRRHDACPVGALVEALDGLLQTTLIHELRKHVSDLRGDVVLEAHRGLVKAQELRVDDQGASQRQHAKLRLRVLLGPEALCSGVFSPVEDGLDVFLREAKDLEDGFHPLRILFTLVGGEGHVLPQRALEEHWFGRHVERRQVRGNVADTVARLWQSRVPDDPQERRLPLTLAAHDRVEHALLELDVHLGDDGLLRELYVAQDDGQLVEHDLRRFAVGLDDRHDFPRELSVLIRQGHAVDEVRLVVQHRGQRLQTRDGVQDLQEVLEDALPHPSQLIDD